MIFSYEKFYSLFSQDIILLPSDYPYLYTKDEDTKVYLGEKNHWRLVSESLVTFMTNKKLIEKYFSELEKMGLEWTDPWENHFTIFINLIHACLLFPLWLFTVQISIQYLEFRLL